MLRLVLGLAAALAPAAAQLREVTVTLAPTECAACTSSLPARLARVRGVAGAEMLADPPRVLIRLEADNRVHLTRLLDVVRQDGTGATAARLAASGEALLQEGAWRFRILPGAAALAWQGPPPAAPGRVAVTGSLVPPFAAIEVEEAKPLP